MIKELEQLAARIGSLVMHPRFVVVMCLEGPAFHCLTHPRFCSRKILGGAGVRLFNAPCFEVMCW